MVLSLFTLFQAALLVARDSIDAHLLLQVMRCHSGGVCRSVWGADQVAGGVDVSSHSCVLPCVYYACLHACISLLFITQPCVHCTSTTLWPTHTGTPQSGL